MGEMLKATEPQRAKGTRGQLIGPGVIGGTPVLPPIDPTLSEVGVTKRESSEAQALAKLPKAQQQAVIDGEKSKTQALREAKKAAVAK